MQHPLDYERITIPPHGTARIVCHNWPTCGCGDDCTALAPTESPVARRILFALMFAVAAIGAGLLIAGLS
ncbi:hypothetical protein [Mesorhizobium sp. M7A.F.Ca.ET.027.03.2.1]|uniref:hypothetical protein n=1 Tax=Mesorhizobium sp. M7A.F.Ca.ET.027.03.2.1 TaxID=2496656 RepID=UPI000FCCA229|nr:hypothetical protein [Mesorhizobium sp. M7A.F.Ca.ET.027.03.2.1]RVD64771.1 hypothetical protein EN750_11170 [Mesorhizobium sp. M7A.F.Ca.ET.027.03.2.1]